MRYPTHYPVRMRYPSMMLYQYELDWLDKHHFRPCNMTDTAILLHRTSQQWHLKRERCELQLLLFGENRAENRWECRVIPDPNLGPSRGHGRSPQQALLVATRQLALLQNCYGEAIHKIADLASGVDLNLL